MSLPRSSQKTWLLALGTVLYLTPLLLSLTWGDFLSDSAFQTLQAAQNLAGERASTFTPGTVTQAPLYIGLLATSEAYAAPVGLIVSALGWGTAAVLILVSLRAAGRPRAAVAAALLIVVNPLIILTAGTEYSLVLAIGWAVLALTIIPTSSRLLTHPLTVWLKLFLLILLLGIHLDAAAVLFALTILASDVYFGRANWLPFLLAAVAAALWGVIMIPRYGSPPGADPLLWLRSGYHYLANWQLYLLFAPFVLAGLWDVWTWGTGSDGESRARKYFFGTGMTNGQMLFALLLFWAAAAVVSRSTTAPTIVSTAAIILAAMGAAWLTRKILKSERQTADGRQAALLFLLLFVPLMLISLGSLWELYRRRPVLQVALQKQAAAWLQDNTDPQATLYAPPRVGFLAGRATIPALVGQIRDDNIGHVYEQLLGHAPDYIVSESSLSWDYVTRISWFSERYRPVVHFENDYALDSPVTIWEYAPSAYDAGEQVEIEAIVDDRFELVGYKVDPQMITPGEEIFVTLYLRALQPISGGFMTSVHLTGWDEWLWAWREEQTPRSLPGQWWYPGQIIAERFLLPVTEDIPEGAYNLQVFWHLEDEEDKWPILRAGDDNVLDRIFLDYMIVPPTVDSSQAPQVNARFADIISLDAAAFSSPARGETWEVDLFWSALAPPPANYTVFVHLLDEDGRLVAAHDGIPAENRFPTDSWKPGLSIHDRHRLGLPPDLAPGTYQVSVGMYLWETGERLPVWDSAGTAQPDGILPLAVVEIGD